MTEAVGCPACGAVVRGRRLSCSACGAILAAVRGPGRPVDSASGGMASAAGPGGTGSGQAEMGAWAEMGASAEMRASAEVDVATPEPARAAETERPLPAEGRVGEGDFATAARGPTGYPEAGPVPDVASSSSSGAEAVPGANAGPELVPDAEAGVAATAELGPPPRAELLRASTAAPSPPPETRASRAPGAARGSIGPPPILRDWVGPEPSAASAAGRSRLDLPPERRPVPGAYLPPSAVYPGAMSERGPAGASPRLGTAENRAWPTQAGAGRTAAVGGAMPSPSEASTSATTRPTGSGPTAPGTGTTSELPSALTLRAIGGAMASWLVVTGSVLGVVGFLLPWSPNGVIGSPGDSGYLGRWGLANGAYLLVMGAAFGCLAVQLLETRLPALVRDVVLPLALGGFLLGLGWTYVAGPFGADLGVQAVLLGGLLLVVGGGLALRAPTSRSAGPPTS